MSYIIVLLNTVVEGKNRYTTWKGRLDILEECSISTVVIKYYEWGKINLENGPIFIVSSLEMHKSSSKS